MNCQPARSADICPDRTGWPRNDFRSFGDCGGFAASTLIDTPGGPRPVEALQPGDLVDTQDHGAQPVIWIYDARQRLSDLDNQSCPILIRAGALGVSCPRRDLILSPRHRILVGDAGQFAQAHQHPALAPARALMRLRGVRAMRGRKAIHWYNFAFRQHQIVRANGVLAESLLIGPSVLGQVAEQDRVKIGRAFSQRHGGCSNGPPARMHSDHLSDLTTASIASRVAEHRRSNTKTRLPFPT